MAGHCISATHEALSLCPVMPVSMATGQAAGVCAALAATPAAQVREELTRQGASLGVVSGTAASTTR